MASCRSWSIPLIATFCIYRELDAAFQRGKGACSGPNGLSRGAIAATLRAGLDGKPMISHDGMTRLSPLALAAVATLLLAAPASAREDAVSRVEAGAKEAGVALAGPKPLVDIVCPIMHKAAAAGGL